jgi:hypothetical protein
MVGVQEKKKNTWNNECDTGEEKSKKIIILYV